QPQKVEGQKVEIVSVPGVGDVPVISSKNIVSNGEPSSAPYSVVIGGSATFPAGSVQLAESGSGQRQERNSQQARDAEQPNSVNAPITGLPAVEAEIDKTAKAEAGQKIALTGLTQLSEK